jgi:hypothetical protein
MRLTPLIAGVAIHLLICAWAVPGSGQIFNGPPLGWSVSPLGANDGVSAAAGVSPWFTSPFPTCAGGPEFQMTLAVPLFGVYAVSTGYFEGMPLTWPLATLDELTSVFGGPVNKAIRSVEYSPYEDRYFASLTSVPPFGMDSVIVEFDPFGYVDIVFTAAEMGTAVSDRLDPLHIEAAPDGTLWVTVDGSPVVIYHIDPDLEEGSRILETFSAPEVAALFPAVTGLTDPRNMGSRMAADDQGRLFFSANVYDTFPGTPRQGLYRRNTDGTITDMATPEAGGEPWKLTVQALERGIHWDSNNALLVGQGAGMFLFNPNRPGWHYEVISGWELTSSVLPYRGTANNGPIDVCSGPTSYGDESAYIGFSDFVYYYARFDLDLLDVDLDLLTGAEEAVIGTDPLYDDTDGGGILDGIEQLDYSDPLDGTDDRLLPQPPETWTLAPLSIGSEAWSEIKYGLNKRSVAHPGGDLRMVTRTQDIAYPRFYRWRGPDIPAWMTVQKAAEEYITMQNDGFAYGFWPNKGLVRLAPPGVDVTAVESIIDPDQLNQLLEESQAGITGIAVLPAGDVYATFPNGKLIHVNPEGKGKVVYDGVADALAAGIATENGLCNDGSGCTCQMPIGPVTYEPVRGIVYFWVKLDIYCGNYVGALSTILVAVEPDGKLTYVGHGNMFDETNALYGALDPIAMEPDRTGGLWVLGTDGLDRLLYRIDPNFQGHDLVELQIPGYQGGNPIQGTSTALAHAYDLTVTPDGSVYVMPMYYYSQYPPEYSLMQLLPVEPVVKAGDFLLVNPEAATLGRLLPLGGGMQLLNGDPLQSPEGVAATDELIILSDSERGQVGFFPVGAGGKLEEPTWVGALLKPEGLDLDDQGRAVVAESGAGRIIRLAQDGTEEILAEGEPLVQPMDVVCLADGEFLVADRGKNRIIRYDGSGVPETFAVTDQPISVTLGLGRVYFSSNHQGIPFAYYQSLHGADALGSKVNWPPSAGYNEPGGIAADGDGNVVWMVTTSGAYDKPPDTSGYDPSATETYPVRFNPRGYATVMARNGMGPIHIACDVAYVRPATNPLPPRPVLSAEAEVDGGPGGGNEGTAGDAECTTSGTCSMGGTSGAGGWFLLVLVAALLCVFRKTIRFGTGSATGTSGLRTTRLMPWCLVVIVVVAGSGCKETTTCNKSDTAGSNQDGIRNPDTDNPNFDNPFVQQAKPDDPADFPACPDPVCVPGTTPVCEGETARKRCYGTEDLCPAWSSVQSCQPGVVCVDGRCELCQPECYDKECGDDGCGGVCGTCAEDYCCNGGTCTYCEPDCDGKVCGPDWAGGSCGECGDKQVCSAGQCYALNSGSCLELDTCLNDCPPWDDWCWDDCLALLPGGLAKYQFTVLQSCTSVMCRACWADEEDQDCYGKCLQHECRQEYIECAFAFGHLSCADAYDCLDVCQGTDDECWDECVTPMTMWAYAAAIDWEDCMLPLCPEELSDEDLEQCKEDAAAGPCAEVYAACFGPCEPTCMPQQECGPDMCTGTCGVCPEGEFCGNWIECQPVN